MSSDGRTVRASLGSHSSHGGWLLLALLVSVTANLFLGGVLLGRSWAPQPPAVLARGSAATGFVARIRSLPTSDRLRFVARFARHRPEIRAARVELRAKGEAARAALVATAYDQLKAEAAFAEVRAASTRLQAAIQTALLDSVAGLSPQSRSRLAAPRPGPSEPLAATP